MSRTWSGERGGKVFEAEELPGQRPGNKAGTALNDGSSMEC